MYFMGMKLRLSLPWVPKPTSILPERNLAFKLRMLALGVLLSLCIGVADYFTGYEAHISVFYWIPLIFFTWRTDARIGLALTLVNAGVSLGADLLSAPRLVHSFFPYWNSFEHLIVSDIAVAMLSRIRKLNQDQARLISELNSALAQIKTLRGMIPICAWCKKVRGDGGYWNQVEDYVRAHSQADFTHSICPECEKSMKAQMHYH